jgi:hypothetical protein
VAPEALDHEAFHPGEAYSVLRGCLPSPFRMVYCSAFKLRLESTVSLMAEVHHLQIYVNECGVLEETLLGLYGTRQSCPHSYHADVSMISGFAVPYHRSLSAMVLTTALANPEARASLIILKNGTMVQVVRP